MENAITVSFVLKPVDTAGSATRHYVSRKPAKVKAYIPIQTSSLQHRLTARASQALSASAPDNKRRSETECLNWEELAMGTAWKNY
jgi:hypothetical protein